MSCWAVIVAAGRGERAGLGKNKVYYSLGGRTVLSRCLDAFVRSGLFEGIVLVISARDEENYRALCRKEGECPLVKHVVHGGESRRDSVYNGLMALPAQADLVAVHDAARPFVTAKIIKATLDSARMYDSGVISTPMVDTVKLMEADGSVRTLPREQLRAVQTPQSFEVKKLIEAHRRAREEGLAVTDDAMLFEHYYGSVRLVGVPGGETNVKLTNRSDFDVWEERHMQEMRVGQGYDVHRLAKGRRLVLCGVEVPHEMGLDGHSDADVAVHALMDALLGALGEGDIGRHFPDTDPAFKGISSMLLLDRVMALVREKGYAVENADVTIVAQRPKLAGHIPGMRSNIATALAVDEGRVNIKATTTERLGFEGQELGISAQAVCLLRRHQQEEYI